MLNIVVLYILALPLTVPVGRLFLPHLQLKLSVSLCCELGDPPWVRCTDRWLVPVKFVAKQDKKKKPRGRAHKRMQYNRRFVTAVVGFGKKRGPNSSEK